MNIQWLTASTDEVAAFFFQITKEITDFRRDSEINKHKTTNKHQRCSNLKV